MTITVKNINTKIDFINTNKDNIANFIGNENDFAFDMEKGTV